MDRFVTPYLRQHQLDALASFAFNVGAGGFQESGVRRAVNRGDAAAVPIELARWNKSGGKVLPGLIVRRAAEARLFTSAVYG